MSEHKPQEGDRVMLENNGRQFAGTIDEDGWAISDIDGHPLSKTLITRKLEGIERAKTGDIVVDRDGKERKILAIDYTHTVATLSYSRDYDAASTPSTFKELEEYGYTLKSYTEDEPVKVTLKEIADLKGVDVSRIKVVE